MMQITFGRIGQFTYQNQPVTDLEIARKALDNILAADKQHSPEGVLLEARNASGKTEAIVGLTGSDAVFYKLNLLVSQLSQNLVKVRSKVTHYGPANTLVSIVQERTPQYEAGMRKLESQAAQRYLVKAEHWPVD